MSGLSDRLRSHCQNVSNFRSPFAPETDISDPPALAVDPIRRRYSLWRSSSQTGDRTLENVVIPDPGNTPATAYDVGVIGTSPLTLTDSVNVNDRNDYFRITLTTPGNLNLALTGLSTDADVQLLNVAGTVLNSSTRGSVLDEAINHTLDAGIYYIRVFQFAGSTNYTLRLSATPAGAIPVPSNLLPTEINLGNLDSTPRSVINNISNTDTADIFRFHLLTNGDLNLTLAGLTANADMRLIQDINQNGIVDPGEELARSQQSGITNEAISVNALAAGTYFVQVYQFSGNTSYTLQLATQPTTIPDNAGNTLAIARNLGPLVNPQTFNDFVGDSDPNDYYRFTLANTANFNLSLTGLGADANVQLIQDGNSNSVIDASEVIAASLQAGTLPESLNLTLTAGTYHVRVFQGTGNTNYTLTLAATATELPPDAAGNTLTTALDVGILNGSRTFNDFVGSSDPNDYYRFTLANNSGFNLSLNNLTADADVQLLNATGTLIASSTASGTSAESISRTLGAGTYYLRIYPYSGSTNYTLNLSATTLNLPPGFNPAYGYGLVNAATAVAQAIAATTPFPAVPNLGGNFWDLDLINAPEVWANNITGQNVVVAVVDTGVDYTHPDLDQNIWTNPREIAGNGIDDDGNGFVDDVRGWDFVSNDNNPLDLNGHGTHVAGTIAAENNGIGALGVAYNARIMPIRALDENGYGSWTSIAAGIRYAANNGAQVINLSLGGAGFSGEIAAAVEYATQRGSVVVMASGNEAQSQPAFPANLANQWGIAVGAVNSNNQVASFSNLAGQSPLNYVVAPGVSIYSTTPNNTYRNFSGTSMAAPHVAGVAALILSANNRLSPAQVVSLLTGTANPTGITV